MIHVLALAGSPRIGGNSETLLDELLRGAAEAWRERGLEETYRVEKIHLAKCRIEPCSQCDYCNSEPGCPVQDDMQALYPKLIRSDWLILASPIYFMAHNAQTKLFIDRCQPFWAARHVRHKPLTMAGRPRLGVFIAAGATHGAAVFAGARVTMKWLFDALDSQYWGECCVEGLEGPTAAREAPEVMRQAYELGLRMGVEP